MTMNIPNLPARAFACVLLLVALSPGLAFASGETISKALGNLPPGVEVKIFFAATVDSALPPTDNEVSVQGNITGSNFTAGVTDDPSEIGATDATVTAVPTADLEVTLSGDPATIPAGGTLVYTVKVVNNGPDTANTTRVIVTLDPNVNYVSHTGSATVVGQEVTFAPGGVTSGVELTEDITVTVDNPLPGGTTDITSTAEATTTTDDPISSNDTEDEVTTTQTGEAQ